MSIRMTFAAALGAVCLAFISPASATAIGAFSVANCSGGGITISALSIVWSPSGTATGTGCIDTGIGTNVTYSGGALGSGVAGNIKNLAGGGFPVDQFMTFTGTTLDFVLTGLGPGSANTTCVGLAMFASCSPFAGSPFILTNIGGGHTLLGLTADGTILDGGVISDWSGAYSTQLNLTAAQIQAKLLGGLTVSSTYSGDFSLVAGASSSGPSSSGPSLPEPATLALLGLGLAGLGFSRRRRQ